MKTMGQISVIGLVAATLMGCAPARLSVHVDLYRFSESNKQSLNQMRLVESVQIESGKLQNTVQALFVHYREARSNLLTAQIVSAQLISEEEDPQGAIKAQTETYTDLMKIA